MNTRPCPRPALALLAITLSLLLGACRDKESDTPAAIAAPAVDSQAGDAGSAAEGPRINYWNMASPLVTGTYAGVCNKLPENQTVAGGIVLGADGKAVASGIEVNMLDAKMMMFNRKHESDGMVTGAFSAVGDGENVLVNLSARAAAEGNEALLMRDAKGIVCGKSRHMTGLTGKSFYAAFAPVLDTPRRTIDCFSAGTLTARAVDFQAAGGMVTFGKESYDVNTAQEESAMLHDRASALSYTMVTPDERSVTLIFDEHGKLRNISILAKVAPLYTCKLH